MPFAFYLFLHPLTIRVAMRLLLMSIGLLLSLGSVAQIVSMDERKTKNPEKGLQGEVNLSLNFTHNNQDIIQTGNKLKLQYNDSLNTYLFSSDLNFSAVNGQRNINQGSFGLVYNYKVPDKIISAEAIYQYEYNRVKKLKHRNILGGGPRFKVADKKAFKLSMVAYSIYLNEIYEKSDNIENRKSLVKFSSMLTMSIKISDDASFKHLTYYEPDYSDPNDYRIWSESNFKMKINTRFSFSLNFRVDYDSVTPSGVDNMYYALRNSFAYSF